MWSEYFERIERSFQLAEHVEVKGASLENGLLHVDLANPDLERFPRFAEAAGHGLHDVHEVERAADFLQDLVIADPPVRVLHFVFGQDRFE